MTADETRCGARREPNNNYDDAAICDLAPGHRGAHYQSTPWQETWTRAPTPPDAGGTAMTEERLAEIALAAESVFIPANDAAKMRELIREVTRLRTEATRPTGEEDTDEAIDWSDIEDALIGGQPYTIPDARRIVAALRARLDRAEGENADRTENVARAIYDAMRENDPEGKSRPWVERGNSEKQDEARRRARAALSTPTPPDAGGTAIPVERLNDPSAWLEAAGMDAQQLLRAYSDATIAAAREEDAAGPHAETDPDVDRAWERVSDLRTQLGGYIVALEDQHSRLRTEATRPTGEEDDELLRTAFGASVQAGQTGPEIDARAKLRATLAALRARLDRAEGDTARLNWIEECGQEVSPTFEPRDEAWCVVDRTLEQVKYLHELTTYAATLRGAIDAAMANAHESNAARALSTPTPPTTEPER